MRSLGRVVLVAARKPIRAAIGVEFNERLARQAAENAQTLRGRRAPVSIRHEDATEADYDDCTVFWLYNPFGPTTMVRVLDRIRASHEARPRRVRVIYALPKQADLFDAQSWLRRDPSKQRISRRTRPSRC